MTKYNYSYKNGLTRIKTNARKYVAAALVSLVTALGMAIPALAAPTPGAVAGPGCFGKWRAGSVQVINGEAPGTNNAGALHFSERAGDNSTTNANDRATCEGL